ncbi:hypothetical protein GGR52DRAFT_570790 [Hypoxylon sp. FL1284]|nr:hypothetical protein GGR52DRAFT_570790 [Hypoxylon sp. FL1284]
MSENKDSGKSGSGDVASSSPLSSLGSTPSLPDPVGHQQEPALGSSPTLPPQDNPLGQEASRPAPLTLSNRISVEGLAHPTTPARSLGGLAILLPGVSPAGGSAVTGPVTPTSPAGQILPSSQKTTVIHSGADKKDQDESPSTPPGAARRNDDGSVFGVKTPTGDKAKAKDKGKGREITRDPIVGTDRTGTATRASSAGDSGKANRAAQSSGQGQGRSVSGIVSSALFERGQRDSTPSSSITEQLERVFNRHFPNYSRTTNEERALLQADLEDQPLIGSSPSSDELRPRTYGSVNARSSQAAEQRQYEEETQVVARGGSFWTGYSDVQMAVIIVCLLVVVAALVLGLFFMLRSA